MGVKNLWDMLESCKKTLPLHHLQNKRVCIDLSCWIVQLQNVNKTHCAVKEKVYIRCLFHRLRALIALNCSLIFVADGAIPAIKIATYRHRLNSGHEGGKEEKDTQKAYPLRRNAGSEFSRMIKEAKLLGSVLGIPCLDGIEEAEAQCASLDAESLCDGCFSSDSDVLLFGARTVYRDICLGESGHVVCYEMGDIENKLGLGRNSLIALALLLGSDYCHGVHGLGPESASQIIKSVGDKFVLQKIISGELSFSKRAKASKKPTKAVTCNGKMNAVDSTMDIGGSQDNLERQRQFLQVIDAYLNPKCHPLGSDAVYTVLAQHPFQHHKLQHICTELFDWPPEKTDEYILPRIAERDLRRFANLRSTSSELGVQLPLDKMPVKCPVSEIIKPRKIQGTECFEVLWEGIDGLKTSIVPADIVHSACPERIAEFEDRRALKKQQNNRKPRAKKQENLLPTAEIDSKIETLLRDIELGSSSSCRPTSTAISLMYEDSTTSSTKTQFTDLENTINYDSQMSCSYAEPSLPENEVIDLLSPSPPIPSRQTSMEERVNVVINFSDSEDEMSPDHVKKARELRMFLASIRDEIY